MLLASGYALGLGVPFLVIGFGMDRAFGLVHRLRRYQRPLQITSGLLLIAVGLMLVTGRMILIAIWAQQHGYFFDLPLGSVVPTYLIAVLAGQMALWIRPSGFYTGHAIEHRK